MSSSASIDLFQKQIGKCSHCNNWLPLGETALFIYCNTCNECVRNTSSFANKLVLINYSNMIRLSHNNSSKKSLNE